MKSTVIDNSAECPTNLQTKSNLIKKSWYASATVFAFFLFVVFNILPSMLPQYLNGNPDDKNQDQHLANLRHSVLTSPYETDHCGPWPWWLARAYFQTSRPALVVMGDSQINAAFIQADATAVQKVLDCATDRSCIALRKALINDEPSGKLDNIGCVNLALGGAMPSDYYLLSKSLFTQRVHPELVIIALSPRSFWDSTLPCAGATEIFQFFAPFVQLNGLVNYAFDNPLEKYFWIVKSKLAFFTYRQELLTYIGDWVKHELKLFGLYKQTDKILPSRGFIYSGSGFVPDKSNIIYPNSKLPFLDNRREYKKRFSELKKDTFFAQQSFFIATLAYLKQLKIKVLVVSMPMLEPVKELLPNKVWQDYRSVMKSSCTANDAYWLDLSDSSDFVQSDFLDHVHLNSAGGEQLVKSLATFIIQNNIL